VAASSDRGAHSDDEQQVSGGHSINGRMAEARPRGDENEVASALQTGRVAELAVCCGRLCRRVFAPQPLCVVTSQPRYHCKAGARMHTANLAHAPTTLLLVSAHSHSHTLKSIHTLVNAHT
jgi:hypothetical protein